MKKLPAKGALLIYLVSTVFFCGVYAQKSDTAGFDVSATDLGVLCINTAYPAMSAEFADSRDNEAAPDEKQEDGEGAVVSENQGAAKPVVTGDDPLVLIVHTHATETYLPHSTGNYHSREELNTVRDVGNSLAASLEKQGISVVHDKTLHDYPSYNSSYSRSYNTTQQLLKKYPSIKCVIDLHRDAGSSDAAAATLSIDGKSRAKYSYVVGTGASTYQSNIAFVKGLNSTAAKKYDGFTGKVLERSYKYNQDLSEKYLLMEIGYNKNRIEDARNTADIFGKILADTLKKG